MEEFEEMDDIYLNKPITKIHLSNHKTENIQYLCTAMQGWRKSMVGRYFKWLGRFSN